MVTEAVDESADSPSSSTTSASAPLAESEESEQSETEKMGSDGDPKPDEDPAIPRCQCCQTFFTLVANASFTRNSQNQSDCTKSDGEIEKFQSPCLILCNRTDFRDKML